MEYIVGAVLALVVAVSATLVGFDRDRSFYPTILVVVASYYDLFAAMGGSAEALVVEGVILMAFIGVSVIGFKTNLWLVAGGLFAHGTLDIFHGHLIDNHGVPAWWPMFCMTYDVAAAGYLAWLLVRPGKGRLAARAGSHATSTEATAGVVARESFGHRIRPFVDAELRAASVAELAGDFEASFRHLERAHILGQDSTVEHARVHARMLIWGLRSRNVRETCAQVVRIVAAATMTALRAVPSGNTGGSNVSAFRAMPLPHDLATIVAQASAPSVSRVLAS